MPAISAQSYVARLCWLEELGEEGFFVFDYSHLSKALL